MKLSRRGFLKLTGTATAAATLTSLSLQGDSVVEASSYPVRLSYAKEVTSICTFCGTGCSILYHVKDGVIINAEGDPDSPINEGALCPKGGSIFNLSYMYEEKGKPIPNPNRLTKPLYRAPGSDKWEEKDWDWMMETIVKRIKDTRDNNFEEVDENGVTVNRTQSIAWLGSSYCTNEENYIFHKMARAMGIINIDHCARL